MSDVRLIRAPRLFSGVPYAYASTAPAGTRFVFLAGACPLDADGRVTPVDDFEGQAEQVLVNLRDALDAAGCSLTDVVQTRVLVASGDRDVLARVYETIRGAFGSHDVPSTLVGVAALGWSGQLVEVEAIAAVSG